MTDIAKELSMKPSGATYTVDNLIKEKLIERFRSNKDRRVVLVKITNKGKKLVHSIKEVKGEIWKNILKNFNEKEIEEFTIAIKKVHSVVVEVKK